MWAVALAAAALRPGLLTASGLAAITADEVAELFRDRRRDGCRPRAPRGAVARSGGGPQRTAYAAAATALLAAADGRLGDPDGLLSRLAAFAAYSDPLAKKAQLFAKICERRGWFAVARSRTPGRCRPTTSSCAWRCGPGSSSPGTLDEVRAETRAAFKRLAIATGISPPLLDDMLWELGRDDPDLLGSAAGDLSEPPRDPGSAWY